MTSTLPDEKKYLKSTYYIDIDHPTIHAKAVELIQNIPEGDNVQQAVTLFNFVRDEIPYKVNFRKETYSRKNTKASSTLALGSGYCVQKAVLLTALARAVEIPAKLHFVDLINYMTPQRFIDQVGSNQFIFHGYSELWLEGKWVEANVAFDQALCERKGFPIINFDGRKPGLFAHHNEKGEQFVEYTKDRGDFPDVPYFKMIAAWAWHYGLHHMKKKKSN